MLNVEWKNYPILEWSSGTIWTPLGPIWIYKILVSRLNWLNSVVEVRKNLYYKYRSRGSKMREFHTNNIANQLMTIFIISLVKYVWPWIFFIFTKNLWWLFMLATIWLQGQEVTCLAISSCRIKWKIMLVWCLPLVVWSVLATVGSQNSAIHDAAKDQSSGMYIPLIIRISKNKKHKIKHKDCCEKREWCVPLTH